ncbi:16658_t:CDS:1, partial [Gigaspora margarita]
IQRVIPVGNDQNWSNIAEIVNFCALFEKFAKFSIKLSRQTLDHFDN